MRLVGLAFALALLVLLLQSSSSDAPPAQAANLQGDVDCDNELAPADLIGILRDEAGLGPQAPCLPTAGDLNCDGEIDGLDVVWLLRWLVGADIGAIPDCPPPGDPVDAPIPVQFVGLNLSVVARVQCSGEVPFHEVIADWELVNFDLPVLVTISALFSWGPVQSVDSAATSGQEQFVEADQGPGQVTVVLEVSDPAAPQDPPYASTDEFLILQTCFDPPPPPDPGFGFTAEEPATPDPPLTGPAGIMKEVDVAHAGGSPFGPTQDITIVGVGTGAAWRLYSYATDTDWKPVELKNVGPFAGNDIKLRTLTPEITPKLELEIVIAAYLHEGNLWLSSWRVADDGTLTFLDNQGYGLQNGGVFVRKYAIAHRQETDDDDFVIVTPVIGDVIIPQRGTAGAEETIRTVTWKVNGDTGSVNGAFDSGSWGEPHEDTELAVEHLPGEAGGEEMFVVSYRRDNDAMTNAMWQVPNNGNPNMVGTRSSGLSLRGSSNVLREYDYMALAPLADGGFVSAGISGGGDPEATSWEVRLDGCAGGCSYSPFWISDDDEDQIAGAGVELAANRFPTLTDGSSPNVLNGATQTVRAMLTDALWEDNFGEGNGEVYSEFPQGEFTSVGIASVTKVMTLYIAVQEINEGDVALGDIIEIDAEAANVGGSQMNVALGEKQSLRNLLYGMMTVSGNDAALAIGKHVSGSTAVFVNRMNLEASDLGLTNTTYNQPAGGGYSTPQDQVTLWLEAAKDPLFREFTTRKTWNACGETSEGDEICRVLVKFNDSGWPGLGPWKNGNLGFHLPALKNLGVPLCTACLVAEATRLGRTMITAIQQSGSSWGDSSDLFDYGFMKLFTPDRVAHAGQAGTAKDFGIDAITDGLAVVVRIDGADELQVCTFGVQMDLGKIEEIGCDAPRVPSTAGGDAPQRTQVEIVRSSTLLWEGEYLTIYWLAGHIHITGWRDGPKEP